MPEEVSVSIEIGAEPDLVWSMISDLPRMSEWSPENDGAEWIRGAHGPERGARFRGTNRNGKKSWSTDGEVIASEAGRLFTFRIKAAGVKVSEWSYQIEPVDGGCRVTETWLDQRGGLARLFSKHVSGVAERSAHNSSTMEETLQRLKAAAELPSSDR